MPNSSLASADENEKVEQIKATKGSLKLSDGDLLKWLRAHNGSVEEANTALAKHQLFRQSWGMDKLLTEWKAPEVLLNHCGFGFVGPDVEGSPVLVSFMGSTDVQGVMQSCQSSDYIKFSLIPMEQGLKQCEGLAKENKNSRPFEQMLVVFDMQGLSSSHYSFKPFSNSFLTLLSIFQDHYPMLVKKIFLIRAPSMAWYVFKLLTPFLSERTKNLIEITGDDWQETVMKSVPAENWPNFLGGKLECPSTPSKLINSVRQSDGPVPETCYLSNQKDLWDGMQDATVYAGDKHLVEVQIEEINSTIKWKYSTTGEDIGFAIYFDASGDKGQELEKMTVVYSYIRLECSLVPAWGSVVCDKPGRYLVEFDNYYSWFSAKDIRYYVNICEP